MSDTLTVRGDARGHMLIAEQAGVPVAAISLTSGAVAADPRTADAATRLLRLHRYQLLRQGGEVGQRTALLRRLSS